MIHTVKLPELINKQLSEIVSLQIWLLRYAASRKVIDKSSCAAFLNSIPEITGRGAVIAKWIWNSKDRHEPLEDFAAGPIKHKRKLIQRVQTDIHLFNWAIGYIRPLGLPQSQWNKVPNWQQGAWKFLQNFYKDFSSQAGFPAKLFSSNTAFKVQDFLKEFTSTNNRLHVCAACDECDYRTHRPIGILSEKDHYLPKSLYPQLACHPFNLVPICHYCNQPKSNADPLKSQDGERRSLKEILLPYREDGLGSRTYLEILLGSSLKSSQFVQLKPLPKTEIQQKIEAFRSTFEIPERWGNSVRLDQLGERLFDRIFDQLKVFPAGFSSRQALLDVLDKLLDVLHQEQGKEPYRYAQTWLLAALINQEVEPVALGTGSTTHTSALLQEVDLRLEQEKKWYSDQTEWDEIINSSANVLTSASHREGIQAARNLRQLAK